MQKECDVASVLDERESERNGRVRERKYNEDERSRGVGKTQ